jgi:hypothetical protein
MSVFENSSTSPINKSTINLDDEEVTFVENNYTNENPISHKISEAIQSHTGICVTPIRTKIYPTKEVAVITVDKFKSKAIKIQPPSGELLCRFRDVKVIEDGSWIPFFNAQLVGVGDFIRLHNGILEMSITRFDPSDDKLFLFGQDYVNIDLPTNVSLSYEDDETNKLGTVRCLIERNENDHYIGKVSAKDNTGIPMDKLGYHRTWY